jgi:DNA adenine methylase
VRAAGRVLAEAHVRNVDFETVLEDVTAGDLVYLDPPYQPMSATADFAEYSAEGFDRDDQERLLAAAERLDDRGVSVVLSNSGVLYDAYDEAGFFVDREGATRAINSDAGARGEVDEIIATNVPPERRQADPQASLGEFD